MLKHHIEAAGQMIGCRFIVATAFIFPNALVNYQNEDGVINLIITLG